MPDTTGTELARLLLVRWELVVLYLAAASIASGVVLDFIIKLTQPSPTIAEERIVIATLTMSLFFVLVFAIGWFGIGKPDLPATAHLAARLAGSAIVMYATVINIAGRFALGRQWSNQIEIREGHELIRKWPYSWSRHPLYGSLILFGIGMGILMINPIVVAATLFVFAPAMRHRAVREERLLVEAFGIEYREYQQTVPMLLPGTGR